MGWPAILLAIVAGVELVALVVLTVAHLRLRAAHAEAVRAVQVREPRGGLLVAQKAIDLADRTASRLRHGGLGELLMGSVDDIVRWAKEDRTEIVRVAGPDGLVTIVFTDIEDSTAANVRLGDRMWLRVLQAHEELVRDHVRRATGHVVKSQGDGFMIVFAEPDAALRATVGIQRALRRRPPRPLRSHPIRMRVGLHLGRAVARDGDYFGRDVAMAARVAGEARGGEILISSETYEALDPSVRPDIADTRDVLLKGFDAPTTLYAIDWVPAREGVV